MKLLGKRVASVALASTLVIGGLAGCSGPVTNEKAAEPTEEAVEEATPAEAEPQNVEPTTAAELVAKAKEAAPEQNGHADFVFKMAASESGYDVLDMGLNGSFDYVGENRHGTMTVSALGEESTYEFYSATQGTQTVYYQKGEDDTEWTQSTSASEQMPIDDLTEETLLSQGQFAKTTTGYTITVPGKSIFDVMTASSESASEAVSEEDNAALQEAINSSTAVYSYDTAYRLTSMSYNFAYAPASTASEDEESEYTDDSQLTLTVTLTLSNQGQVQQSAVALPSTISGVASDSTTTDGTSSTTGTTTDGTSSSTTGTTTDGTSSTTGTTSGTGTSSSTSSTTGTSTSGTSSTTGTTSGTSSSTGTTSGTGVNSNSSTGTTSGTSSTSGTTSSESTTGYDETDYGYDDSSYGYDETSGYDDSQLY